MGLYSCFGYMESWDYYAVFRNMEPKTISTFRIVFTIVIGIVTFYVLQSIVWVRKLVGQIFEALKTGVQYLQRKRRERIEQARLRKEKEEREKAEREKREKEEARKLAIIKAEKIKEEAEAQRQRNKAEAERQHKIAMELEEKREEARKQVAKQRKETEAKLLAIRLENEARRLENEAKELAIRKEKEAAELAFYNSPAEKEKRAAIAKEAERQRIIQMELNKKKKEEEEAMEKAVLKKSLARAQEIRLMEQQREKEARELAMKRENEAKELARELAMIQEKEANRLAAIQREFEIMEENKAKELAIRQQEEARELRVLEEWRVNNTSTITKNALVDTGPLSEAHMTGLIQILGSCTGKCTCNGAGSGPVKCTCKCECKFCVAAFFQLSSFEFLPYFIYQKESFQNFGNGADFLQTSQDSVQYHKMAYSETFVNGPASLQAIIAEHMNMFTSGCSKIPIPSIIVIHVPKGGLKNWSAIYKIVSEFAAIFKVQRVVANSTEDHETKDLVCSTRSLSLPTDAVQFRIIETTDCCSDEREVASLTLDLALKIYRCQEKPVVAEAVGGRTEKTTGMIKTNKQLTNKKTYSGG